ncbi:MAG: hypothetical protein NTW28_06405 [Candidatus Solibacter sp.]|nr:hypothetical protein [Candidatus Solibacter sp.]
MPLKTRVGLAAANKTIAEPHRTKAGFTTGNIPEVTLAVGDRLRQDIQLQVATVGESIEVTATSPALQTDSSTNVSLINARAIQDLPINGLNFVVLAQLAAGANEGEANGLASGARPDDAARARPCVDEPQPTSSNNFLIDGMDDDERLIGSVIVKPSIDALAEMKVQSSLFEFFRNPKLDARNFLAGSTKPSYKHNQFGGSLGGPIRKDRIFFFGDCEGLRMRQGQTFTSSVSMPGACQGNFAGLNARIRPAQHPRRFRGNVPAFHRTRLPQTGSTPSGSNC